MNIAAEDPVLANRRRQLKKWIDQNCGGMQSIFIASTNDGQKQINQGELSAMLKNKPIREKRARSLEAQAGMPPHYLDLPADVANPMALQEPDQPTATIPDHAKRTWPFTAVSMERLAALKRALGPRRGLDAMHDIDSTLETAVLKWEKRVSDNKSVAA